MPRILPAGMQTHLDEGTTTLCWCWKLSRRDGATLGFTDHDRDLTFDSTVFEATSGFTGTELQESVGLSVDNLDVQGALQSDAIRENDILAGLYDDAQVTIYRVNWANVTQRALIKAGSLGEITRSRNYFRAEVRGVAHYLQQPRGRIYQYPCDADLGDSRCQKNISSGTFTGTGAITTASDARLFVASGLGSYTSEWFTRGLLTWTSGANNTYKAEVKTHRKTNSGIVYVELWYPPANPLTVADAFTIQAGCDKQVATCRIKFNNIANFRGFPHIPGNDAVVRYPNRDDPNNNGGATVA